MVGNAWLGTQEMYVTIEDVVNSGVFRPYIGVVIAPGVMMTAIGSNLMPDQSNKT